jgi:hypothetical protein
LNSQRMSCYYEIMLVMPLLRVFDRNYERMFHVLRIPYAPAHFILRDLMTQQVWCLVKGTNYEVSHYEFFPSRPLYLYAGYILNIYVHEHFVAIYLKFIICVTIIYLEYLH